MGKRLLMRPITLIIWRLYIFYLFLFTENLKFIEKVALRGDQHAGSLRGILVAHRGDLNIEPLSGTLSYLRGDQNVVTLRGILVSHIGNQNIRSLGGTSPKRGTLRGILAAHRGNQNDWSLRGILIILEEVKHWIPMRYIYYFPSKKSGNYAFYLGTRRC